MKSKKSSSKKPAAKVKSKKVYDAVHPSSKVLRIHTKKIEKRGGEIIEKEKTPLGTMIKYKF